MRKTKLTLVSLFALIGVIGIAWAAFTFAGSATDTHDLGLDLAGYSDAGTVAISNASATGFTLDNETAMSAQTVTFDVLHTLPTGEGGAPAGTASYSITAAIPDTTLATYIDVNFSNDAAWNSAGTTATVTVYLTWKPGMVPTNVAQWNTLNNALASAGANATIVITATVTYA